jgi:hypothetical protein
VRAAGQVGRVGSGLVAGAVVEIITVRPADSSFGS